MLCSKIFVISYKRVAISQNSKVIIVGYVYSKDIKVTKKLELNNFSLKRHIQYKQREQIFTSVV
jgi:hypothetical protein